MLKLRAHHICCLPFVIYDSSTRGAEYVRIENKINQVLKSEPHSTIIVIEGIDELCKVCPFCQEDRCESLDGNEEAVRKWDAILLKELGLSFGEALTVKQWQSLIKEKSPFRLCQKCKKTCNIRSIEVGEQ